MPKLKLFFILLAIAGSLAAATPDSGQRTCDNSGCEAENQYVLWQGQYYVQSSPYGSTWLCIYGPGVCTYAYMYCPQWGNYQFVPCKLGQYCRWNQYGCQPNPILNEKELGLKKVSPEKQAELEKAFAKYKAENEMKQSK